MIKIPPTVMTVYVESHHGHTHDGLYDGVSALGIGHIQKDLVIVYPPTETAKERALELGNDWTRLIISKTGIKNMRK